jgi:hypothetical protein
MPGSEEFVQSAVRALEAGGLVDTVALGFENERIFLSDHDREHPPKQ